MGIHDREYFHSRSGYGGTTFQAFAHSAVGTIIILNVIVWIAQLATRTTVTEGVGPLAINRQVSLVTELMRCTGDQIFGGFPQIWRLVTCTFAHADSGSHFLLHILWNMLLLFWFGRELERLYGRGEFWFFYLFAGIVATLAEVGVLFARGLGVVGVIGASGSVMGVVTLFAFFYPHRRVLLFFVIPVPCWLLCAIIVGMDVFSAIGPDTGNGIANLAHLGGALCGFLWWRFDLRWSSFWAPLLRLRRGDARRKPARKPRKNRQKKRRGEPAEILTMDGSPPTAPREPDHVSQRMDELLEKISRDGMDSLTDEEREFMIENSQRYRST